MGRRKSAAELEEMLRMARSREQARLQRRSDNPAPYRSRGDQTEALYRSMLRYEGTNRLIYKVSVDANTVPAKLSLAQAGLLAAGAATPTGEVIAGPAKGSGIKPGKIQWYFGVAPTVVAPTAAHGRWIKRWSADSGGQSHRSSPFSRATGVINSDVLADAFRDLVRTPGGALSTALGSDGDATLIFERGNVSN